MFLGLVVFFDSVVSVPIAQGGFILLFMMIYQATIGSQFFPYATKICCSAAVGMANFVLFMFILIISLITPILFTNLQNAGTFALFAGLNAVAIVTIHFYAI